MQTTIYFTIIIPTLNEEKYLPKLLANLKSQTCREFEVIVVDGQSIDKTIELVKSTNIDCPKKLISTEVRNVSYQRNLGAKNALGKVLIFFDADTQIPKNYLARIKQAFETKKPHLLTTYVKSDYKRPRDRMISSAVNFVFETSKLIGKPTCCGAMMAFRRGVFEDIGGFDEKTPYAEDAQIVQVAVSQNYKFIILPTPRYTYSLRRFHSEGTMDAIYKYVKINLDLFRNGFHGQKPDYPMGGHVFSTNGKNRSTVKPFEELFSKLKKTSADQRLKMKEFVEKIF